MVHKGSERWKETSIYGALGGLIKEIEAECHIKALFGRIAGSRALGLPSKTSDYDICIYGRKAPGYDSSSIFSKVTKTADLPGGKAELDVNCLLYERAERGALERYNKNNLSYPTNFYRSEEESRKYHPSNLPEALPFREEYAFMAFHLLILSDTIWAAEDMGEFDFNQLYQMEKTIDLLDTFFVRAYGNYQFFIKSQEEVLVRKYLNTFSQIFSMEWILRHGTKPPADFKALEGAMMDDQEAQKRLDEYFEINQNTALHRSKHKEKASDVLGQYIGRALERQREEIAGYSRTETYRDIIRRTEPGKRPRIYDEKRHAWRQ